jgi:hypothetical protein
MAFSQATIQEVFPPLRRGAEVFLSWSSSAPSGSWFQVYVNGQLAWWGVRTWTWVPVPSGPVRIDLGAVAAGEETTDWSRAIGYGSGGYGLDPFAAADLLPAAPSRRAQLSWSGGYFLGATLAGFHVYGESTPGGGINYGQALATIAAYPAGIDTSGFGLAGYGSGGFGLAAGTYTWASGPLSSGTWNFALVV